MNCSVSGWIVGIAKDTMVEGVSVVVTEDVARGVVEEAGEYASKDVTGTAPIFSCLIW